MCFVVWGCTVYCALGWDAVSFKMAFRSHNNQGLKYHHRIYISFVCLFYVLYFFVFFCLYINTSGCTLALWLGLFVYLFWVYNLVYFDSSPCLWSLNVLWWILTCSIFLCRSCCTELGEWTCMYVCMSTVYYTVPCGTAGVHMYTHTHVSLIHHTATVFIG
jgi:hypothetical protein